MIAKSLSRILVLALAAPLTTTWSAVAAESEKPRLIVLADMGNEPDEVQQMHHLLVCSNEVELEGLLAVSGKYLRPEHKVPYRQSLHPELFHQLIDGYEQVYPNLRLHASGWATPEDLRSLVTTGQPGYGIAATGDGKSSPGSKLIIAAATRADSRPLHLVMNAGSNTLAQALKDYRATHSPEELASLIAKLRVFENGAQDNAGAWICHEFPDIFWVRSNFQTYCYGGPSNKNLGPHTWKPHPYSTVGQDAWANQHVRTGHGALGALFPKRKMGNHLHFMEGGGTIPWMGFISGGLGSSSEPSWGNWSGRFTAEKQPNVWSRHADIKADEQANIPFAVYTETKDDWTNPADGKRHHNNHAPVWRWRQAMWNDLQARMDWCIHPFEQANHHPVASLNGDSSDSILRLTTTPGTTHRFSAKGSTDPDRDSLTYSWWTYPEAGRTPYGKPLTIAEASAADIALTIPGDAAGKEIHLILEVTDQSKIVPLVDYRRAVITVKSR